MTSRHKYGLFFAAALMLGLVVMLQLGCQGLDPIGADGLTGGNEVPATNQPPITHLTLYPDDGARPDTTTSYKLMNWWADDPDGWVTGYQYRWGLIEEDTLGQPVDTAWFDADWAFTEEEVWTHTEKESGEFILPIRTSSATFAFQVRAIDNYGAIDETGVEIAFPVVNSPPAVDFRLTSNPTTLAGKTYYTFPVRSFVWDATDPDGNTTIDASLYAVDPQPGDTSWVELDGRENSVTLENLSAGEHRFLLKVRDLAGFDSEIIQFPDSTISTDPKAWIVREPAEGGRLIVKDFPLDAENVHLNFYKEIYDSTWGPEDDAYSVWSLEHGLPYVASDLTSSLMLFDRILWYTYYGEMQLLNAFNSMYTFINTPGNRMLLTTMTLDSGMVLDLAESTYKILDVRLAPMASDSVYMVPEEGTGLPLLNLQTLIGREVYGLVPTDEAQAIYRLDPSTSTTPQYEGEPIVGVRREDLSYTLITLPLQPFLDKQKVGELLRRTFDD